MNQKLKYLLALAAVGSTCLFSADLAKPQPQIVLLRTYITTNQIPAYVSGPETKPGDTAVNAIAIMHPAKIEITTNYVLGYWSGTNAVELITASKH